MRLVVRFGRFAAFAGQVVPQPLQYATFSLAGAGDVLRISGPVSAPAAIGMG
jgi:hypothetical protein